MSNRSQLVFHCQLAQGSPTTLLSGFNTVKELYSKIAESYDIAAEDILFCTLNTHKLDMSCLLAGQVALNDFIFVHVKGQRKEVEVVKDSHMLGLTISDNGCGNAFVKRIKADSVAASLCEAVKVGDHIEKLNGVSMVNKRHYEVAKCLRDIPIGDTFTLRLIEPLKSDFAYISSRSKKSATNNKAKQLQSPGAGKQTLRFKGKSPAVIEEVYQADDATVDRLNSIIDTYMGISDRELALSIWEYGKDAQNPVEFSASINGSELAEFQVPEDVMFDLWGVVSDVRRRAKTISNERRN